MKPNGCSTAPAGTRNRCVSPTQKQWPTIRTAKRRLCRTSSPARRTSPAPPIPRNRGRTPSRRSDARIRGGFGRPEYISPSHFIQAPGLRGGLSNLWRPITTDCQPARPGARLRRLGPAGARAHKPRRRIVAGEQDHPVRRPRCREHHHSSRDVRRLWRQRPDREYRSQSRHEIVTLLAGAIEIARPVWGSTKIERQSLAIHDAIEALAYSFLGQTYSGWENSDRPMATSPSTSPTRPSRSTTTSGTWNPITPSICLEEAAMGHCYHHALSSVK